ncbi:OB-fold nucleic acid binding domain-containing protein, partial [Vibrio parahaemolyticus]
GDMVHPFLKRRNGEEPVSYPSEAVKSVLERTMGVPIFQEQVIKLAMVAAGFSGGEADQLRRAMASWKKNGDLAKFKPKLLNGMQERGYDLAFAERIFEQICGFGEYGFPESHSASFAVLAYCSAWLKYYYPAEFYTALLNSQPMGFYSPSQLVQDARRHGVEVLPICVNHSYYQHHLIQRPNGRLGVQLGFRLVKGFNEEGATRLVERRPKTGYHSIQEVKQILRSRRDIELLASANAFQILSGNRYNARWAAMDSLSDLPLFHHIEEPSVGYQVQPSEYESLIEDYASTGLSLNRHPITLLEEAGILPRFTRMKQLVDKEHKSLVTVAGVVTGRQSPGTAAGVTFFTLEDDTGNINVVVWSATARAQKQAYLTSKILMVKGILEREGEVIHVIAGKLIDCTHYLSNLQSKSRDFH